MEKRDLQVELKSFQEGKNLYIEGYAAVFGNVDSYNDIVVRGAFSKVGKRVAFCYQHDFDKVIGKITELKEDDEGLYFKAKVSNTNLGRDVAILIEDEAIS